jgi:hypothetical protein
MGKKTSVNTAKIISIAGDNLGGNALGEFCENLSTVDFFVASACITIIDPKVKKLKLTDRQTPENEGLQLE